ncbi:MAG: hypothetical protein ACRELA_21555 [Candidatus Rokuibacteriota bacterium]
MIPWRRHDWLTYESRKFSRIPRRDRLTAAGMYEQLCDLVALKRGA